MLMARTWFSLLSIFSILLALDGFSAAEFSGNSSAPRLPIKGQQYVRQSAVARLVGGPVPPELLALLQNNSTENFTPGPAIDQKKLPQLVTDEVKTTITRMVIPLSPDLADSERYRSMLQKFLARNQVNLTHVDRLQGSGDLPPPLWVVALKLNAAAHLRGNILAALAHILYLPSGSLPANHHAPLAHIFRLLQLKRIPVIDLLESIGKLSKSRPQQQWLTIFGELEKHIPAHMKSCTTYLLESLQELTLDMDSLLLTTKSTPIVNLLSGIPVSGTSFALLQRPLLFPKRILEQVQNHHEEALGRPLAAIVTSAATNQRNLTPRLLALILLHLPRDEASPVFDEVAWSIVDTEKNSNSELKAVAEASSKGFATFDVTANEVFRKILLGVVQNQFEGVEKYEMLLGSFPVYSQSYVINRFEAMAPLMNSKNVLTFDLLDRAVDELAPQRILFSKRKLAGYIEREIFSPPIVSRYACDTPTQLLQMSLFTREDLHDTFKTLQLYLHIKNRLEQTGVAGTLESAVYSLALEDEAPQEAAELGVLLVGRCHLAEGGSVPTMPCLSPQQCSVQVLHHILNRDLLPSAWCKDIARRFLGLFSP